MRYKKSYLVVVLCALITLLIGCNSKQDGVYDDIVDNFSKPTQSTEENSEENLPTELEGTLKVTTFYDGYINILADDFMDLHPNVEIEVVTPLEFDTLETYAGRLNVELLNGISYE